MAKGLPSRGRAQSDRGTFCPFTVQTIEGDQFEISKKEPWNILTGARTRSLERVQDRGVVDSPLIEHRAFQFFKNMSNETENDGAWHAAQEYSHQAVQAMLTAAATDEQRQWALTVKTLVRSAFMAGICAERAASEPVPAPIELPAAQAANQVALWK